MAIVNVQYNVPFTWCGTELLMHTNNQSGAYVDTATNYLWLHINLFQGAWPWVDLITVNPVHYGTYQLTTVTDISAIILGSTYGIDMKSFVFAMYICDQTLLPYRGEIGIEPCQWGNAGAQPMSWLNDNLDATYTGSRTYTPHVTGANVVNTLIWNPMYVKWMADGGTTGHVEQTEHDPGVSPPDNGAMFLRLMLGDSVGGVDLPAGVTQLQIALSNFVYTPLPHAAGEVARITTPRYNDSVLSRVPCNIDIETI